MGAQTRTMKTFYRFHLRYLYICDSSCANHKYFSPDTDTPVTQADYSYIPPSLQHTWHCMQVCKPLHQVNMLIYSSECAVFITILLEQRIHSMPEGIISSIVRAMKAARRARDSSQHHASCVCVQTHTHTIWIKPMKKICNYSFLLPPSNTSNVLTTHNQAFAHILPT